MLESRDRDAVRVRPDPAAGFGPGERSNGQLQVAPTALQLPKLLTLPLYN